MLPTHRTPWPRRRDRLALLTSSSPLSISGDSATPPTGRKTIMSQPPRIFDTGLIARHLTRRPKAGDFVTDLVLSDLHDRLAALIRDFPRALIIGPDRDVLP